MADKDEDEVETGENEGGQSQEPSEGTISTTKKVEAKVVEATVDGGKISTTKP
jgi:hypothetical protein